MTDSRKLEDIASNLDDMSLTLEEIKEDVVSADTVDTAKLDQVQAEIEKAAQIIEESLDRRQPRPRPTVTQTSHNRRAAVRAAEYAVGADMWCNDAPSNGAPVG